MNLEQVTNIAIQINTLQQKVNLTLWAAGIGCAGSIVAAVISGITAHRVKETEKKHQTQWAYVEKQSALIESAIEVCTRMLFNKILLAYQVDQATAATNLFVLQKDALVIESQLVIYGSAELVDAVHDFANSIVNTPTDQFLGRWTAIYEKGREYLLLFRKTLGEGVSQKYQDFEEKLKDTSQFQPPPKDQIQTVKANTMGGITQSSA